MKKLRGGIREASEVEENVLLQQQQQRQRRRLPRLLKDDDEEEGADDEDEDNDLPCRREEEEDAVKDNVLTSAENDRVAKSQEKQKDEKQRQEKQEQEEEKQKRAKFFARLAPQPCIRDNTIVFIPRKIEYYFCNKCCFRVYVYGVINNDRCDLCQWPRYKPFDAKKDSSGGCAEQAEDENREEKSEKSVGQCVKKMGGNGEDQIEKSVVQCAKKIGEECEKAFSEANEPLLPSFSAKPTCFERFYDAFVTKRKVEKSVAAVPAAAKEVGLFQSIIETLSGKL